MAAAVDSSSILRLPGDASARFPTWLVSVVTVGSLLPAVIGVFGVDLGLNQFDPDAPPWYSTRAVATHVLLEWSAFCIAAVTVALAGVHYSIRRDVTMPIIGAALCFAGLLDAFRALAILGLTETVEEPTRFVPFTWALSRTYHACILVAGTLPFVLNRSSARRRFERLQPGYVVVSVAVFAVLTFVLVKLCAHTLLPVSLNPEWPVARPWDVIPLIVYVASVGFVLPRFHKANPSLFAHGIVVSMVPNVLAEVHATFGARALFDHDSVSAQLLKITAYLVPLCGLFLDYVRAHTSDVAHEATRAKLRVARDVQQGLLPESAPAIPGFDLAGRSEPTEAVGGDYFDYLVDGHGRVGLVVGDVSGHELAASIVLSQTRAYLRALATAHDRIGPMLTELNHFLQADMKNRWFVTMFLARIDPRDRTLRYIGAGHAASIVRADGSVVGLAATTAPLGVVETEITRADDVPVLAPGDVLLITSDGVTEATPPGSKEQFGIERTTELVARLAQRPAAEIVDALFDAVAEYRGGRPAEDDVTVVVARGVE